MFNWGTTTLSLQKLHSVVSLKVMSDTKQSSSSIFLCFFFIDLYIILLHRFLKWLVIEFKTIQWFPAEMEILGNNDFLMQWIWKGGKKILPDNSGW